MFPPVTSGGENQSLVSVSPGPSGDAVVSGVRLTIIFLLTSNFVTITSGVVYNFRLIICFLLFNATFLYRFHHSTHTGLFYNILYNFLSFQLHYKSIGLSPYKLYLVHCLMHLTVPYFVLTSDFLNKIPLFVSIHPYNYSDSK